MDLEKFIKEFGFKFKLRLTKCKKCNAKLDYRMTTELENNEKTLVPEFLIIFAVCKKCKVVYLTNLINFDNIPKYSSKNFEKILKNVKYKKNI